VSTEQIRREVLCTFEDARPGFDALIDQGICEIREAMKPSQRSLAVIECAVKFSDVDQWNETFFPSLAAILQLDENQSAVLSSELHRVFLAYLLSICLHRLVWP
jgi:hypothetical protein